MRIARALYDEIVAHALLDAPDECCGIVSSRGGQAVEVFRMENTFHTPFKYSMDAQELLRVVTGIEDAGLEVGIIYHSHTRSEPYPSPTDVNLAFWGDNDEATYPGALYLIVGVKRREHPVVRVFTIPDKQTIVEEHLEII